MNRLRNTKALKKRLFKQKKEFAKWQKLHELIGSADGKKFKVFAQGLTFENSGGAGQPTSPDYE